MRERFHGDLVGQKHILCADVGGTTFDVGLENARKTTKQKTPTQSNN
jgi:N-methylhydantoinase A/oxoprolinase/acetone carboxylase beta subunit